jgi:hypothetical protein
MGHWPAFFTPFNEAIRRGTGEVGLPGGDILADAQRHDVNRRLIQIVADNGS